MFWRVPGRMLCMYRNTLVYTSNHITIYERIICIHAMQIYIYIILYAGSKIRTSKGKVRHHNLSCWTSRLGIPLNTYCIHCLEALELSQAVQGMLFVGNNGNDDSSAKAIKEPLRICCRNMLKLSHERLLVCAIIHQSYGDVPYLFLSMYVSSFEHTPPLWRPVP